MRKARKLKFIISKTTIIFLFFLLSISLMTIVSAKKIEYNYLIRGNSMYPAIDNREFGFNVYKVITISYLEINKVYCYNYDKRQYEGTYQYICHRLIEIKDNKCIFKGDNNLYPDWSVKCNHVALEVLI